MMARGRHRLDVGVALGGTAGYRARGAGPGVRRLATVGAAAVALGAVPDRRLAGARLAGPTPRSSCSTPGTRGGRREGRAAFVASRCSMLSSHAATLLVMGREAAPAAPHRGVSQALSGSPGCWWEEWHSCSAWRSCHSPGRRRGTSYEGRCTARRRAWSRRSPSTRIAPASSPRPWISCSRPAGCGLARRWSSSAWSMVRSVCGWASTLGERPWTTLTTRPWSAAARMARSRGPRPRCGWVSHAAPRRAS